MNWLKWVEKGQRYEEGAEVRLESLDILALVDFVEVVELQTKVTSEPSIFEKALIF